MQDLPRSLVTESTPLNVTHNTRSLVKSPTDTEQLNMTSSQNLLILLLLTLVPQSQAGPTPGSWTCGERNRDSSQEILVVETCGDCAYERCRAGSEKSDQQRHCVWSDSSGSCVPAMGRTRPGDSSSPHLRYCQASTVARAVSREPALTVVERRTVAGSVSGWSRQAPVSITTVRTLLLTEYLVTVIPATVFNLPIWVSVESHGPVRTRHPEVLGTYGLVGSGPDPSLEVEYRSGEKRLVSRSTGWFLTQGGLDHATLRRRLKIGPNTGIKIPSDGWEYSVPTGKSDSLNSQLFSIPGTGLRWFHDPHLKVSPASSTKPGPVIGWIIFVLLLGLSVGGLLYLKFYKKKNIGEFFKEKMNPFVASILHNEK